MSKHTPECSIHRNDYASALGALTMNQVLGPPECNCRGEQGGNESMSKHGHQGYEHEHYTGWGFHSHSDIDLRGETIMFSPTNRDDDYVVRLQPEAFDVLWSIIEEEHLGYWGDTPILDEICLAIEKADAEHICIDEQDVDGEKDIQP